MSGEVCRKSLVRIRAAGEVLAYVLARLGGVFWLLLHLREHFGRQIAQVERNAIRADTAQFPR